MSDTKMLMLHKEEWCWFILSEDTLYITLLLPLSVAADVSMCGGIFPVTYDVNLPPPHPLQGICHISVSGTVVSL